MHVGGSGSGRQYARMTLLTMNKHAPLGPVATMSALAFTSGFVDVLSFVALFGLFAAHITGNVVMMAASLTEFHHGFWIKLLAVPSFVLTAIATRLYIIRRERHALEAAAHVMIAQSVLLGLFMVVALVFPPFARHHVFISPFGHQSVGAIAAGMLAAAAMAVQNTAARTFLAGLSPTTVMTGNLIQVIVDAVDVGLRHGDLEAKRARLARLVPMLLAFVAGIVLGALGYHFFGFLALLLPIATTALLAVLVRPQTAPV